MREWISLRKPEREQFEGRKVMSDPGVHSAVAEEIQKRVPAPAKLLEIGAGAGALSLRLYRLGYEVHAVDIDARNFDVPQVSFTQVKAEDTLSAVLGKEKFQVVVAVEVIEHVTSTAKFLREAAALLAPGGYLVLTTPNLCSVYSRLVFLKEGRFYHFQGEDSWKMGHINPVPYFVLEQFANEYGFALVTRRGVGSMPVVDWSRLRLRNLITVVPRLALYCLMGGPGPKEGNCLMYSLRKRGTMSE